MQIASALLRIQDVAGDKSNLLHMTTEIATQNLCIYLFEAVASHFVNNSELAVLQDTQHFVDVKLASADHSIKVHGFAVFKVCRHSDLESLGSAAVPQLRLSGSIVVDFVRNIVRVEFAQIVTPLPLGGLHGGRSEEYGD